MKKKLKGKEVRQRIRKGKGKGGIREEKRIKAREGAIKMSS